MRPVEPLREVEANRRRIEVAEIDPLYKAKLKFGD
jgi:hypothetical protein